jgi:hypothetical protein
MNNTNMQLAKITSNFTRLLTVGSALAAFTATQLAATEIQVTRIATNIAVSWPEAAAGAFYLQVATNLTEPVAWKNATAAIWTNGGTCYSTIGIAPGSQFYRLKAWEVLFDGTSTAAFRGYRQAFFPNDQWNITPNGELKSVVGTGGTQIITTNEYDDFELLWEWKTGVNGNSGVLYRGTEYYDEAWQSAPEYQLIDDANYSLDPRHTTGAVYDLIAPANTVLKATGQWNQCRVLVQSNHVEHWLNGSKVAEYELNSPGFAALVASRPNFSPYLEFAKARKGYIAVQNWTPEVWLRNIKVHSLAPK